MLIFHFTRMKNKQVHLIPFGKQLQNSRKSAFFKEKSTISMAMFNSKLLVMTRRVNSIKSHSTSSFPCFPHGFPTFPMVFLWFSRMFPPFSCPSNGLSIGLASGTTTIMGPSATTGGFDQQPWDHGIFQGYLYKYINIDMCVCDKWIYIYIYTYIMMQYLKIVYNCIS